MFIDIGGNLYDPENMKRVNESAAAPYDDNINDSAHYLLHSQLHAPDSIAMADDVKEPTNVDIGIKLGARLT
ncbi:hypothetical protein V1522DRAFT_419485 [Lipomyces starkeyi]